jgi:hypothetical protein
MTTDWTCSGCGRHYNFSVACCPECYQRIDTVTTGGSETLAYWIPVYHTPDTPPKTDTNLLPACTCVVKRTEVAGMGIIYARSDCPTHGQFHGARC